MKKFVFISLMLSAFFILISQLDFQRFNKASCAFCDREILDAQVFYRAEQAFGILTHKPAVPGHVLIIPQRHVERFEELTLEEMAALGAAIQKVDAAVKRVFGNKDYILLQKNGRGAGQSVPHVHFHYLPATRFLALRFFLFPWLKPISSEKTEELRETLSRVFQVQGD